jgi:hypothetical protein
VAALNTSLFLTATAMPAAMKREYAVVIPWQQWLCEHHIVT